MIHRIYLSSTNYYEEPGISWKSNFISTFNVLAGQFGFKADNAVTFIDPIAYESTSPVVVNMDIQNIDFCDVVVFYMEKLSIGTLLELAYCTLRGPFKKLYFISSNEAIYKHPWMQNLFVNKRPLPFSPVKYCSTVEQAVKVIITDLMQEKGSKKNED